MKRDLNKDEEQAAFRRKNREDGNPDRRGKAKNVATEEFEVFDEGNVPNWQKNSGKDKKGKGVGKGVMKARKQAKQALKRQLGIVKEDMSGMSQKSGDKRSTDSGAGMTAKGVAKYNRRTGGDLKTAVTTPPSKLKPGSKAAGRRKSFCARSRGWTGERGKAARRRWNC